MSHAMGKCLLVAGKKLKTEKNLKTWVQMEEFINSLI